MGRPGRAYSQGFPPFELFWGHNGQCSELTPESESERTQGPCGVPKMEPRSDLPLCHNTSAPQLPFSE